MVVPMAGAQIVSTSFKLLAIDGLQNWSEQLISASFAVHVSKNCKNSMALK
jgi:hypothetical protein